MPFKSEKQRRYLHINKPSIAKAWEKKYALGGSVKKLQGGGVPYGPPPLRGPNPQVPPIKFSRGGGSAIRGTKFKGVF